MTKPLVSGELWARVKPLFADSAAAFQYPGRRRLPDRAVLKGIFFALKTGDPVGGSAAGDGLRLGDEVVGGGWPSGMRPASGSAWTTSTTLARSTGRARSLTARTCGPKGASRAGPLAGRPLQAGHQHHLICCGRGVPLAATLTAANRHDKRRRDLRAHGLGDDRAVTVPGAVRSRVPGGPGAVRERGFCVGMDHLELLLNEPCDTAKLAVAAEPLARGVALVEQVRRGGQLRRIPGQAERPDPDKQVTARQATGEVNVNGREHDGEHGGDQSGHDHGRHRSPHPRRLRLAPTP